MPKNPVVRRTSILTPGSLLLAAVALAAGFWLAGRLSYPTAEILHKNSSLQVYFSPNGGATRALSDLIDQARKSICVEAYSFTSRPLIRALIRAKQRGVDVQIILDKSHLLKKNYRTRREIRHPSAALKAFYNAGIPTYIDARYLIAHNKVMLIDGKVICTGSFNYSYAAAKYNAENMLVIRNMAGIYSKYENNFKFHEKTSQEYHPGVVLKDVFHWADRHEAVDLK